MSAEQDLHEYTVVLEQATEVLLEREAKYKALWKDSGAVDNAQNLYSKAQRIKRGLEHATSEEVALEYEDDLLDIINYATFTLRNIRAGRLIETQEHLDTPTAPPRVHCRLCDSTKDDPYGPCGNCGKLDREPRTIGDAL